MPRHNGFVLPATLLGAMILLLNVALGFGAEGPPAADADPAQVARLLTGLDVWVLPQPKAAVATGSPFDLRQCQGICLAGTTEPVRAVAQQLAAALQERSGVSLEVVPNANAQKVVTLGLYPEGTPKIAIPGLAPSELDELGEQGYVVHIDGSGVTAVARGAAGLHYAAQTIAQIAADRTLLPGVYLRDWPSMRYRGGQYDISRGQMPMPETLQRLARILGEAKANVLELYMEDLFQWRSHPDIAQPEAMTPEEARSLSDSAAQQHMEVRPLLQVLGHFDKIGSKPAYRELMVPIPPGGIAGHPWTTTVDIRKPEAVALVSDLMEGICQAFPGTFVNVDVTEIAAYGFTESGTKPEELPPLVLAYVLKLREIVARHGMRLMVAQYALDSPGHANGIGPVFDQLPRDIAISSYYTAAFVGGWDKDYPFLQQKGFDYFTQSWIASHDRLMPYVEASLSCSDLSVSRGCQYGARGSITCDWGDSGHYHLPATTWYPFLYHAASAWTGAKLDRDYFNQAFSRQLFGTADDRIAKAIVLAASINGQPVKIQKASADGTETVQAIQTPFYHEFFADPFSDISIVQMVEPGEQGRQMLLPADEAVSHLEAASPAAVRNRDALEGLLFTARNYQALGKKLLAREHYLDEKVPRRLAAAELTEVAESYEGLREEFQRLWLAECKDAGSFRRYLESYDKTITPCRKKAAECLSEAKIANP